MNCQVRVKGKHSICCPHFHGITISRGKIGFDELVRCCWAIFIHSFAQQIFLKHLLCLEHFLVYTRNSVMISAREVHIEQITSNSLQLWYCSEKEPGTECELQTVFSLWVQVEMYKLAITTSLLSITKDLGVGTPGIRSSTEDLKNHLLMFYLITCSCCWIFEIWQ